MQNAKENLEADDVANVAGLLEQLFRLTRRLSPSGEYSLTIYSALASLSRHGDARLTELAAYEGVSQPTMTQAVTRLKKAGLVHQVPDPSDGRAVLIGITDAGCQALADRRQARSARVGELLAGLDGDDQQAILAAAPALQRLVDAVPDSRSAGGRQ